MKDWIKICPDCGSKIPADAKECPICSAVQPVRIWEKWWFWAVLGILAVLAAGIGVWERVRPVLENQNWGPMPPIIEQQEPEQTTAPEEHFSGESEEIRDALNEIFQDIFQDAMDETIPAEAIEDLLEATVPWEIVEELKGVKGPEDVIEILQGFLGEIDLPVEMEPTCLPADPDWTPEQKEAYQNACRYVTYSSFSRSGLVEMLVELDGAAPADAEFAVDALDLDWQEQALRMARDYLECSAFSEAGLTDQLIYEGFSEEEAAYGVENCGADWYAQAVACAEEYLDLTEFTREELYSQLMYEKFTQEQTLEALDTLGVE